MATLSKLTKSTVPPGAAERKLAFRIALAQRGMSASEFASLQGVSKQAVSQALNRGASARLLKAIDRFIATTQKKFATAA